MNLFSFPFDEIAENAKEQYGELFRAADTIENRCLHMKSAPASQTKSEGSAPAGGMSGSLGLPVTRCILALLGNI
jgi:hypothetical protein